MIQGKDLNVWKTIPTAMKNLFFFKFKNSYKIKSLSKYSLLNYCKYFTFSTADFMICYTVSSTELNIFFFFIRLSCKYNALVIVLTFGNFLKFFIIL